MLPVVALNVCANFLLKAGAGDQPSPWLLNILSLRSFSGLFCFGLGGIAYAFLLRYVPLGIAQAVLASQYIFTVVGSWLLFNENFDFTQVIGFILVGIGICLIVTR